MEEELALDDDNVSGELIVGASTIPGAYLLPRLASDLKADHPEISFEIRIADSGEIIDSILNHELLLGVVGNKIKSQNLAFEPFFEDQLVLAASKERTINSPISRDQLIEIPFLMRENGSGTRKNIEHHFSSSGVDIKTFNIVAILGSNTAIKEGVKENLGVSIISRLSIRDELESGVLQEIEIPSINLKRNFYGVYLKKRTLPRQYSIFLHRLIGSRPSAESKNRKRAER